MKRNRFLHNPLDFLINIDKPSLFSKNLSVVYSLRNNLITIKNTVTKFIQKIDSNNYFMGFS